MLVLLCASAVGLIASVVTYRMFVQMRSAAAAPEQGAFERVVVAAVNMDLGETITPRHVKLVAWPKDSVPQAAVRSLAEAEGRVVRSSIVVGEPLLEGKLAPQLAGRGGIMPMLVPEDYRAVTIKVDQAVRESGFILPKSRVDVLVSMARGVGTQDRVAKVILQDVLVLAAGPTVEIRDNKPVTVTTVTLALMPEQAERLALAQTEGQLMLATRNLNDKQIVQTRGVTKESLLSDAAAAPRAARVAASRPPAPAAVAKAAAAEPQPRVEYAVSVLRGSAQSEHRFVRNENGSWVEQGGPDGRKKR